jgi:hypothetical protein
MHTVAPNWGGGGGACVRNRSRNATRKEITPQWAPDIRIRRQQARFKAHLCSLGKKVEPTVAEQAPPWEKEEQN